MQYLLAICFSFFIGACSGGDGPGKTDGPEQPEGQLCFAVFSDTHIGTDWGIDCLAKTTALVKFLKEKGSYDAVINVGDVVNYGARSEYLQLKQAMAAFPATTVRAYAIGNHERWGRGNASSPSGDTGYGNTLFETVLGQDLNHSFEVRGYPFIVISTDDSGERYSNVEKFFLQSELAKAARDYPGKPVFVFGHIPCKDTVYGSVAGNSNDDITAILEKYPHAVFFSGHSHWMLGHDRSIWQQEFTAVNCCGNQYLSQDEFLGRENIAERYDQTTALIVRVQDNGDVKIERWEGSHKEKCGPDWLIRAPHDGTAFAYTGNTVAPQFSSDAAVDLSAITAIPASVTFPQAADDGVVVYYKVDFIKTADNSVVSSKTVYSGYHLNSRMPERLMCAAEGLVPGNSYKVRVVAVDCYDNESAPLESAVFRY